MYVSSSDDCLSKRSISNIHPCILGDEIVFCNLTLVCLNMSDTPRQKHAGCLLEFSIWDLVGCMSEGLTLSSFLGTR